MARRSGGRVHGKFRKRREAATRLAYGSMHEAAREGRCVEEADAPGACRLAEHGDVARIPAECGDVVADSSQGGDLIEDAVVPGHA